MTKTPVESPSKVRIRSAAVNIFARVGLDGLTMSAIAKEVGVSATAIYRHYPNREAILNDVWDAGFVDLAERFSRPFEPTSCDERILMMLDRYIAWALENPELFDLIYNYDIQLSRSPREQGRDDAAFTAMSAMVREVRNCVEQGSWHAPDLWSLTVTVWAISRGMFTLYRTGQLDVTPEELSLQSRDAMLRLIHGLRA